MILQLALVVGGIILAIIGKENAAAVCAVIFVMTLML